MKRKRVDIQAILSHPTQRAEMLEGMKRFICRIEKVGNYLDYEDEEQRVAEHIKDSLK